MHRLPRRSLRRRLPLFRFRWPNKLRRRRAANIAKSEAIAVLRAATTVARNDRPRAATKSVRRSASCRRPLVNNNVNRPHRRPIVRKDAATKAVPPKSAVKVAAARVAMPKDGTQKVADPKVVPKAKGANRVAVAVVVAAVAVAAVIATALVRKGRPLRSMPPNELARSMIVPNLKTATNTMPR